MLSPAPRALIPGGTLDLGFPLRSTPRLYAFARHRELDSHSILYPKLNGYPVFGTLRPFDETHVQTIAQFTCVRSQMQSWSARVDLRDHYRIPNHLRADARSDTNAVAANRGGPQRVGAFRHAHRRQHRGRRICR